MPIVRSKSAFVAPQTMAMASPCMISAASSPIMCAPSTFWLAWSTTSFISVLRARPLMV